MKDLKIVIVLLLISIISISYVDAKEVDCNNILEKGSQGSRVKIVQKKLNSVMKCNLDVDGVYGSETYACVVSFQKKYKLEKVDGIVGCETYGKLFSKNVSKVKSSNVTKVSTVKTTKTTSSSSSATATSNKNVMVTGDKVSIRSGTSTKNMVLYVANSGEIFHYVSIRESEDGTWYKIRFNDKYKGSYGYVKANDVKKVTV